MPEVIRYAEDVDADQEESEFHIVLVEARARERRLSIALWTIVSLNIFLASAVVSFLIFVTRC